MIWDMRQHRQVYTIAAHTSLVSQVKFQRESTLVVCSALRCLPDALCWWVMMMMRFLHSLPPPAALWDCCHRFVATLLASISFPLLLVFLLLSQPTFTELIALQRKSGALGGTLLFGDITWFKTVASPYFYRFFFSSYFEGCFIYCHFFLLMTFHVVGLRKMLSNLYRHFLLWHRGETDNLKPGISQNGVVVAAFPSSSWHSH